LPKTLRANTLYLRSRYRLPIEIVIKVKDSGINSRFIDRCKKDKITCIQNYRKGVLDNQLKDKLADKLRTTLFQELNRYRSSPIHLRMFTGLSKN
jgi:hypothetical protein